jgi:hypothetical protein
VVILSHRKEALNAYAQSVRGRGEDGHYRIQHREDTAPERAEEPQAKLAPSELPILSAMVACAVHRRRSMRLFLLLSTMGIAASTSLGCGSNDDLDLDDKSDADFIGGANAGARFPATVGMQLPGGRCGAAKIGPRRFLTAAHCVTVGGAKKGASIVVTGAATGTSVDAIITAEKHSAVDVESVPDTAAKASAGLGLDVAVIELDVDTPDVGIATLDRTPLAPGDKVVIGGSGCVADEATPNAPRGAARGTFRFGVMRVTSLAKYHAYFPRTDTRGKEARLCNGDSGAPAFRYIAGAKGTVIVGVNSFRAPELGVWSATTRLDRNLSADAQRWLNSSGLFASER